MQPIKRSAFKLARALPTRRTAIEDFPWEWLHYIEPRIVRGSVKEGDHWYWNGFIKGGYPVLSVTDVTTHKQIRRSVTSIIVRMFWQVPDDLDPRQWYVTQECSYGNCVNPHHFIPQIRFKGDRYA